MDEIGCKEMVDKALGTDRAQQLLLKINQV